MKSKKIILILMVIIIITPLISNGFEINVSSDKKVLKKNDEFILKVKTNEKIIAGNFEIEYNNEVFEYVEGININSAEKEGKIACIYADLSGNGEDEFLLKFKAIKPSKNSEFKIENKKFRSIYQEESYADDNTLGENSIKITVENDKGNIIIIFLIILIIIFIVIISYNKKTRIKNKS